MTDCEQEFRTWILYPLPWCFSGRCRGKGSWSTTKNPRYSKTVQYMKLCFPFWRAMPALPELHQMDTFLWNMIPKMLENPSKSSCHYCFRKLHTSKLVGTWVGNHVIRMWRILGSVTQQKGDLFNPLHSLKLTFIAPENRPSQKGNNPGWCSTPTLLLICSSFSRENGHPLLICSSLSTVQNRIPTIHFQVRTVSFREGISLYALGTFKFSKMATAMEYGYWRRASVNSWRTWTRTRSRP